MQEECAIAGQFGLANTGDVQHLIFGDGFDDGHFGERLIRENNVGRYVLFFG